MAENSLLKEGNYEKEKIEKQKTRCPLGIFVCGAVSDWLHGVYARTHALLVYRQLYGLQSNVKNEFYWFWKLQTNVHARCTFLEITL